MLFILSILVRQALFHLLVSIMLVVHIAHILKEGVAVRRYRPQGSRIYPAATTQRIIEQQMGRSRNSSGGILFTGNTFVVREEADIDKIAHQFFQLVEQANLNYGGDY